MQTRTKESRKRLQSLILLTAFTCVLLIVSTYAWFTTQKDVNVSNIRAKVEVAEGLQISLDGGKWTQVLDLGNALDSADSKYQAPNASLNPAAGETFDYMPYTGHRNHVPKEFLPVSTSGEKIDVPTGEATADINPGEELAMVTGKYTGNTEMKLGTVERTSETQTDVTKDDYAGYYAFDIFLKNTSKTGVKEDVLQLNSDAYAWVLPTGEDITESGVVYDGDATSGLQNSIRVAFARYGNGNTDETGIVPSTANQAEVIEQTANHQLTKVAIWEPNHNDHVERIITNVGGLFTESGFTNPLPATAGGTANAFWTGTLLKTSIGQELDSVFDWNNTHIDQTPTLQTTTDDTLKGYTVEGVQNLITTTSSADDPSQVGEATFEEFTLAANSITRLRVYVYLEGQDPDCDTDASVGGGIEVKIGLTKGEKQGSMDRYNEVVNEEATDRADYTPATGTASVTGTPDTIR